MPDTCVNLYNLVPRHGFLFYTMLGRPEAESYVQVSMEDIEHLQGVVDGESFMKACLDVLTQKSTRDTLQGTNWKTIITSTFTWSTMGHTP